MLWGLSEAEDLLEKYRKYNSPSDDSNFQEEINILLFGSGDIRHILQTIANQRISRETAVTLNFFVVDGCVEVIARNLLLLDVILSKDPSISQLGRTHLFMDFYGNSLIRTASREYQREFANLFHRLSADIEKVSEKYSSCIDLTGLKYRERDQLGEIFSMWRTRDSIGLKEEWNRQLRNYLGQRYDSREGAFDWDFHMELRDRGAERMSNQEYQDFRETGVAFQFPEYEYSFENSTLVVGGREKNSRFHLVADMHTGPYPAFGLHCEDEEMTSSTHGKNEYRATDIAERNILKILHNVRFKATPAYKELRKHKLGGAKILPGNNFISSDTQERVNNGNNREGLTELENVKINFLSPEMIKTISKGRFKNFFHVAFIGSGCFQYLEEDFVETVSKNGVVIFEILQLSLLPKEKRNGFAEDVKKFGMKTGLKLKTNFNLNKHYTTYDYKKVSDTNTKSPAVQLEEEEQQDQTGCYEEVAISVSGAAK